MNMKILVFSDSHGNASNMEQALIMHPEAEYVFHLGDGLAEFERLAAAYPGKSFTGVKGNLEDYLFRNGVPGATLDIEGLRIFLCHGHRFSVKSSTERLEYYAAENSIDIALFGHTHVPCEQYIRNLGSRPFYIFNPGSISRPVFGVPSYGIIEKQKSGVLLTVAHLTEA